MKKHRVRKAKCIDDTGKDHLFIEIERETWMEVKELPTHKAIENYNNKQKGLKGKPIHYETRAFDIGLIKNWKESDPIS